MIYEYAISPGLFKEQAWVMYWRATLGRDKGRLLSDMPKRKWIRNAFYEINQAGHPPVLKQTMKEHTRRIFESAKFIRNEQPTGEYENWLNCARAAHLQRPFRAIISEDVVEETACELMAGLDLEDRPQWQCPSSRSIPRIATAMIDVLQPMLAWAKDIVLIDRNFRPEEARFRNVLLEIMHRLAARPFGASISYHVGDTLSQRELERRCREHFASNIPDNINLFFCMRSVDELHDRFLLTEIGGVSFSVGLDESLGGGVPNVTISRLSNELYNKEWQVAKSWRFSFSIS